MLIATTNEDDLLERAGVAQVMHLHGSLFETQCSAGLRLARPDDRDNALSMLPLAPSCRGAGAARARCGTRRRCRAAPWR